MLDPRIYRTGFVAVALAADRARVLADTTSRGRCRTTLAPDAFNADNAYSTMTCARRDVSRPTARAPPATTALATDVSVRAARDHGLEGLDHACTRPAPSTATRTLETVTAVRAGLSTADDRDRRAPRRAAARPATAELSGTAALLELARVLAGETQHRTIVLASTSGSAGRRRRDGARAHRWPGRSTR